MVRSPKLGQLINGIKTSVRDAFKDFDKWSPQKRKSNKHLTNTLKSNLRGLAEKLKVDVRHSRQQNAKGSRNSEFIYDVSFLDTSGEFNEQYHHFDPETTLKRDILALECEWSPHQNAILYDFSKLLVARAQLRALVFYQNSNDNFTSIVDRVRAMIKDFSDGKDNDRYLICGLVRKKINFCAHQWLWSQYAGTPQSKALTSAKPM